MDGNLPPLGVKFEACPRLRHPVRSLKLLTLTELSQAFDRVADDMSQKKHITSVHS